MADQRALFDRLSRLDGTVALVTGATSGIGLATAEVLASAGATVLLTGLAQEDPAAAAERLRAEGLDVVGLACDVLVPEDLAATVAHARERHGRLDTVVCNAGAALDTGPHTTSTDAQLDTMVDLHLRSPLRLANLALPLMAAGGGGAFVVMSSLSGLRGNRAIGLYGITKAANAQLARNLAVQWGAQGIRANAVSPGVIDTAFATPITGDAGRREARLERTPLGRFGTPEEVGATVAWLASAGGAFVSGQNVVVDGGTLVYD
jgi:NAD(P)-dependent dehydrogenase (short-subunit alcohol dehydrogenase family)